MKYTNKENYILCTTNSGYEFMIDDDDLPIVSKYSWGKTNNYFMAWDGELQKNIYLHQLLMGTHITRDKDLVVDHINRNRADNRKENLRLVSYQVNSCNRSPAKKNTSKCTGVTWNIGKNRWQATIRIDGKLIMLGMKEDLDEAIQLRKAAEIKYFNPIGV